LDIETHRNHPSSSKDGQGNPRGRPRRPKTPAVSVFGDSEFDAMILEEMDRQLSIREGEIIEKTSLMRAATRAIGLKAAKGDVKAYIAVSAKLAAIENRRRAEREEMLREVADYNASDAGADAKKAGGGGRTGDCSSSR
jgi:hypothetical protein